MKSKNVNVELSDADKARLAGAAKVGIMGGTFDPIHYGHLAAAEAVREALALDLVVFMPAGRPAFKQNKQVTDAEHRYAMTLAATEKNTRFIASRSEVDREGVTYTVDTARALRAFLGAKSRIYFILGADAFADVQKWYGFDELVRLSDFAVTSRPGFDKERLTDIANAVRKAHKAKVRLLTIPDLDISSTVVRKRAAAGESIRYLLPDEVADYVDKHGLYRPRPTLKEMRERLKRSLSEKRYEHSLGVADEAVRLAKIHNADADKAYLAGLLHDTAKEIPDKKLLKRAKAAGIALDAVTKANPSLAHAPLGAWIAKTEFAVRDEDVLNAISYHSTGRPGMSVLEKIIYVADFIEPTRPMREGNEKARQCVEFDLDAAVIEVMTRKLSWIEGPMHPLTEQALEYLLCGVREDF